MESFEYDLDKKVVRYFKMDQVDEGEVMKIVKANNEDYTRVDVGSKQKYFKWIDTKNKYTITLNATPFEKGLISEMKFYVIFYEIIKN